MSVHARSVRGHGAPVIAMMGSSTTMTPANRYSRNVSGGACGAAYFATMKPVLHSRTNTNGIKANQRASDAPARVSATGVPRRGRAYALPTHPSVARRAHGLQVYRHRRLDIAPVTTGHGNRERHAEALCQVQHAPVT